MTNTSQRAFWSGHGGEHWVKKKETMDNMLDPFGRAAMDCLSLSGSVDVLDVGCGSGATTFQIARQVSDDSSVTGVDFSRPLLERAASLNTFSNVRFVEDDVQILSLTQASFSHVFSRFGVMFFDDPSAAFRSIHSVLAPQGTLGFVCWQTAQQNLWQTLIMKEIKRHIDLPTPDPKAPGPFAFGEKEYVVSLLKNARFQSVHIAPYERPVTIFKGYTPKDAVEEMLNLNPALQFLKEEPHTTQLMIRAQLETAYSDYQNDIGFEFPSAAWVVQAQKS